MAIFDYCGQSRSCCCGAKYSGICVILLVDCCCQRVWWNVKSDEAHLVGEEAPPVPERHNAETLSGFVALLDTPLLVEGVPGWSVVNWCSCYGWFLGVYWFAELFLHGWSRIVTNCYGLRHCTDNNDWDHFWSLLQHWGAGASSSARKSDMLYIRHSDKVVCVQRVYSFSKRYCEMLIKKKGAFFFRFLFRASVWQVLFGMQRNGVGTWARFEHRQRLNAK